MNHRCIEQGQFDRKRKKNSMAQNNPADAVLEVNPESILQFILTRTDASGSSNAAPSDADGNSNSIPRCVITLRNPDTSNTDLAFKVRRIPVHSIW